MSKAVLRVSLAAAIAGLWVVGPGLLATAAASPHIAVSPDSIAVALASGDSTQSTVTISNSGDADLHFTLRAEFSYAALNATALNVARTPGRWSGLAAVPTPGARSHPTQMNRPIPVKRSITAGARILLLEDAYPWGTDADERVLAAFALTYDRATSTDLPSLDLSGYRLVIVAGDQSQTFYDVIQAQVPKLENYVLSGGVLEFHAAGWGFNGGDPTGITLPGGMTIAQEFADSNFVLLPGHPAVAGVPAVFYGSYASHAAFGNLPAGAMTITESQFGTPTLVEYGHGYGRVIASGQALEFGYGFGQWAGAILDNLIPYAASRALGWLTLQPIAGTVPPGGGTDVTALINARQLVGGDYRADIVVTSDDSLAPAVRIPVHAHVTGVPLLAVIGPTTVVSSTKSYTGLGASTVHSLAVDQRVLGGARLRLLAEGEYADTFHVATLSVEGQVLGSVTGRFPGCSGVSRDFTADAATFAVWSADDTVHAVVQNSPNVGSGCPLNRHTLMLSYDSPGDSLPFGTVFLGPCQNRSIRIENHGTDVLHVSSVVTSDPAYTVGPTSFEVAPGAAETLSVTLCAPHAGAFDAEMAVTSDGGLSVMALTADVVPPPVAELAPDSVAATLHTGQTADLPLTLSNSGGGTLEFTTEVQAIGVPVTPPAHPNRARVLTTRRLTLPWGLKPSGAQRIAHAPLLTRMAAPPPRATRARIASLDPVVLTDPIGDGGPVDVADVRGQSFPDSVRMTIDFASPIYPNNTGGAISLDVDQNPATGTQAYYAAPGQDIGAEFVVGLFDLGVGYVDLYEATSSIYLGSYPAVIDSQSVTFTLPLSALGNDDGAMDFDGVVGTYSYATDWFPDTGHGTLAARPWLTVIPDHGTVPGGTALPIQAHVDAHGLSGGDLDSHILFYTNDPAAGAPLTVAVSVHVTPAPDLVVTPDSLAFDSLFVGAARVESLKVVNAGVLPLTVTGFSSDSPFFTTTATGALLNPGQFVSARVTFQPASPGGVSGHLTITSDDPDTPSLAIPLTGVGIEPPVMVTSPDSLSASLLVGEQTDRTVTIRNEGAGNLHFSLASEELTPVLASQTAGAGFATPALWQNVPAGPEHAAQRSSDTHRRMLRPEETAGPPALVPLTAPRVGTARATVAAFSFRDGFEDGDFDGWIDAGGAANAEVTAATAANGSHYSLHQFNATPGYQHFSGLAQDFGPVTPHFVGFWVRPGASDQATGYVVLRSSIGLETIWFFAMPDGHLYVNGDVGGNQTVPFTPQTWYHIEFRNIDYTSKTFDYFVNDSLVQSAIPFRNAPYVSDVERMDLYNYTPGSEAWWDEIAVGASPAAAWIHFSTDQGVVPPGGEADVTTTLDATSLLGGEHFANVIVSGDDPSRGLTRIPVRLHVTGVPQILVLGPPAVVSGSRDYGFTGATTVDSLPVTGSPGLGARITLTADGDYGDSGESATLFADGDSLGAVGATGFDCSAASRTFTIDPATFGTMAADGWIVAQVVNSPYVDVFCLVNRHTVTIRIDRPGDHLDFGARYQGLCLTESLRVVNDGTDFLNVTGVSADDPAYTVGTPSFTVPPGGSRILPVTLCVDRLGPIDATLSIASNAGPASTALTAIGLPSPIVAASLDSIGASLLSGGFRDTVLTVTNIGADTLRYQVSVEFTGPPPVPANTRAVAAPATRSALANALGARAGLLRPAGIASSGRPWGASFAGGVRPHSAALGSSAGARGASAMVGGATPRPVRGTRPARVLAGLPPLIATDPVGDAAGVDLTALRGAVEGDSLVIQMEFANMIVPSNLGGALSLDTDRNRFTGTPPYYGNPGQDIGAEFAVTLFDVAYGFVDLYATLGGGIGSYPVDVQANVMRFALPLAALGPGVGDMDADLVVGDAYGPTDWLPDSGHVTITHTWVTVTPQNGALIGGAGQDHTVRLDASGLDGGDYRAHLVLDSNDPQHPQVRIPVGLHVTGVPHLVVSPVLLDFGTVYVGTSRLDSVMVVNRGTDDLHVSGVVSSDPQYGVTPTSFVLAKRESLGIRVLFTPTAGQPAPATLTITSDDPDSAETHVVLNGSGRLPPDIQVTPDSLTASVTTGDSAQRILTIANQGASDLHYTIEAGVVALHTARPAIAGRNTPPARTRSLRPEESPPTPSAQPMEIHAVSADSTSSGFADNFEDGDANGWFDTGYGNPYGVVSNTAANGSQYSLWNHTFNGGSHFTGVYHDLALVEPEQVSFWVRTPDATSYTNYFVIRDLNGYDAIFFFADAGYFYVNLDSGGDQSVPYAPLTWYHIEFRNIDFQSQRFDYYVNGQLVKVGIYFRYSGAIGPFARVDLYSYSSTDAWWDEIAIGNAPPGWISVSPVQGIVAPGAHDDVGVVLRSSGLAAGDYRAALSVQSDDPDTPVLTRPVHFHVIGAPRVAWEPDSLDFGLSYVGNPHPMRLTVMNHGTETLDVTQIASSDPQCVPDTAGFSLAPGESAYVNVVYTPAASESLNATLSFTTNDGHHPTVQIRMIGLGGYPPVMAVSPDSLAISLYSGDRHGETITISNTGLGPLHYHADVRYSQPPSVHPARMVRTGALRSVASSLRWGAEPGPYPSLRASLAGRSAASPRARPARLADSGALPVVVADSVGDGGAVDVVALLGAVRADSIVIEIDFATYLDLANFEGILSLDMDRNPNTGLPPPFGAPPQDVGAEYYVFMSTAQYGYITVFTASPSTGVGAYPVGVGTHSLRFALPRSAVLGGQDGVDVDLVVGPLSGLSDLVPDFGHGTVGGHLWLAVSPEQGSVPGGQAAPLQASIDADGLTDGDYHAEVVVTGNDPVHGEKHVPVHLHVTGGPNASVDRDSLLFDPLFTGGTARETLMVSNHGSSDLHVSGVTFSDPHATMTASPPAPVVPPGGSVEMEIALNGVVTGPFVSPLHIASDDPDQPQLDVVLHGLVADPPDVHLPSVSVDASVQLGFGTSVPFEIDNLGPSPLAWSAEVVYQTGGAVVASAPPSAATARIRTPKPQTPPGDTTPPADRIQTMGPAGASLPARAVARRASRADLAGSQGTALYFPPSLTLEEVRDSLELRYDFAVSAIPDLYNFTEGSTGNYIVDGGKDMYDFGNYLNTDLGSAIPYSDGIVSSHSAFGSHGRYFTRKYPGLFVLAADLDGVTKFRITGDLGSDGLGYADAATLTVTQGGIHYRGFVKRVYGSGTASVNHLIIVRDGPALAHAYSTDTNNDFDEVQNLAGIGRVYYLLFATSTGSRVDDNVMLTTMTRFVSLLPSRWLQLVPSAGVVPPHGLMLASLAVDGREITAGDYPETLVVHTDDPDEGRITVPVHVHADTVTAVAWSLVSADADRDAVRLVWNVSAGADARGTVERREGGGAWSAVGDISADGSGYLRFTDRGVTPGHAYGYRLHLTSPEDIRTSEVALTVPDVLEFALDGARPNPAARELNVAFALPDGAAATLELLDLAGRRLRSEEVGGLGAGRHLMSLGGTRELPGGVYLIRLTRNGRSFVSKVAVVR